MRKNIERHSWRRNIEGGRSSWRRSFPLCVLPILPLAGAVIIISWLA
jgi:hypothetical protein